MMESAAKGDSGFVLVGVVMMVLALTILGLSLFSLSSYEAQFMNRSLDSEQALQCAMGGLDRARFVLTMVDTLDRVMSGLPRDSVFWAQASQKRGGITYTAGPIVGPDTVRIQVAARYNGITRTATACYIPSGQVNYYKRLLTVGPGGLEIGQKAALTYQACATVFLGPGPLVPLNTRDSVWVSNANPTWAGCSIPPSIPMTTYVPWTAPIPAPSVLQFFAEHPPGSPGVLTMPWSATGYTFNGTPGEIRYYYTDNLTQTFSSHHTGPGTTLTVNGFAVWMLPRGFRSENLLTIRSDDPSNACLVIVARNGHDDHNLPGAIWAFGGVISSIPTIFVSDGVVKIEHFNNFGGLSVANHLSIFANQVLLTGPAEDPTANPLHNIMNLAYGREVMDPIIEQLMAADALPNSVGNNPLAFCPGTWRSNP